VNITPTLSRALEAINSALSTLVIRHELRERDVEDQPLMEDMPEDPDSGSWTGRFSPIDYIEPQSRRICCGSIGSTDDLRSVSVATTSPLVKSLISQIEGRPSDMETNIIGASPSVDCIFAWQQDRLSQEFQQKSPQADSLGVQATFIGNAQLKGAIPQPVINVHGARSEFVQGSSLVNPTTERGPKSI
jgi:hypothetical protein